MLSQQASRWCFGTVDRLIKESIRSIWLELMLLHLGAFGDEALCSAPALQYERYARSRHRLVSDCPALVIAAVIVVIDEVGDGTFKVSERCHLSILPCVIG